MNLHFTAKILAVVISCLFLPGCVSTSPIVLREKATTASSSTKTSLAVVFLTQPPPPWRERLEKNAKIAERILTSDKFAEICRARRMSRRNGKSEVEICRELQNAGPVTIRIDFYDRANTAAIAYEQNGTIYINTAKQGAGSPGNIAHELCHQLGYTHFTNFPIFAKNSVPYVVGSIVDKLNTP